MLDLNSPGTKYIFAAARAEDAVLIAAKHMTIAARKERARLRDGCADVLAELRRLAREHFADCPAILPAVDALEQSLSRLADLPGVPEDGPPAEYQCPACDAALKRLDEFGFVATNNPTNIYCSPCLDIIMPPLFVLRSWEGGFGTDLI